MKQWRKILFGFLLGVCICGSSLVFAACGDTHEHEVAMVPGIPATCTQSGTKRYYQCKICHQNFMNVDATKPIANLDDWIVEPALGHKATNTSLMFNVAATCDTDGHVAHYRCVNGCGKTFADLECQVELHNVTLSKLGHQLVEVAAKKAGCENPGNLAYYACQRQDCGQIFNDAAGKEPTTAAKVVLPATGHYSDSKHYHPGKEPTCTQTGLYDYYDCIGCGGKYTDEQCTQEITAVERRKEPHNWEEVVAAKYLRSAATRAAAAVYYQSCAVCHFSSADTGNTDLTFTDPNSHPLLFGELSDYDQKLVYDDDVVTNTDIITCGIVNGESFIVPNVDGHWVVKATITAPDGVKLANATYQIGNDTTVYQYTDGCDADGKMTLCAEITTEDHSRLRLGDYEVKWKFNWDQSDYYQTVIIKFVKGVELEFN